MLSIILITSFQNNANQLLETLGWGPNNFSIKLSDNKFGLHAWSDQAFLDILNSGIAPEGISKIDFDSIVSDLIISVRSDHTNHFQDVLVENGLSINYINNQ